MKKFLFTTAIIFVGLLNFYSQAPNSFNYQTVVRDGSGVLQTNESVTFEISIISGNISSSPVYTETHSTTSNQFGIVNFAIGTGTPTLGTFTALDWSTGDFFVNTQVDLGAGLQDMGTNQLLSVPFALHANTVTNVNDADADSLNEIQTISFVDDSLSISKGNKIALPTGGKTYLILSGDITDTEAAAKITSEVGANTQVILIQNTTALTSVSLPNLSELVSLQVTNNTALTSLDFTNLSMVFQDVVVTDNAALTSLSFPALLEAIPSLYGFQVSNNASLVSLSAPLLNNGNTEIYNNTNLSTIDFPTMTNAEQFSIDNNDALTTVNIPSLTNVNIFKIKNNTSLINISTQNITHLGNYSEINYNDALVTIDLTNLSSINLPFSIKNNNALSSIMMPNLVNVTSSGPSNFIISNNPSLIDFSSSFSGSVSLSINGNTSMTSLNLPNITLTGLSCDLSNNLFPSNQINTLLAQFVTMSGLTGLNFMMNQNSPAPPTGQGITDKNTLITNGNYVTTD